MFPAPRKRFPRVERFVREIRCENRFLGFEFPRRDVIKRFVLKALRANTETRSGVSDAPCIRGVTHVCVCTRSPEKKKRNEKKREKKKIKNVFYARLFSTCLLSAFGPFVPSYVYLHPTRNTLQRFYTVIYSWRKLTRLYIYYTTAKPSPCHRVDIRPGRSLFIYHIPMRSRSTRP